MIGVMEQSQRDALDLLAQVMADFDLAGLTPTVKGSEVGEFAIQPIHADHAIMAPVHHGLRLGFDFMGNRYYITEIWPEVQQITLARIVPRSQPACLCPQSAFQSVAFPF